MPSFQRKCFAGNGDASLFRSVGPQRISSCSRSDHPKRNVTRIVAMPYHQPNIEISDFLKGPEQYVLFWHFGHDVAEVTALPSEMTADSLSTNYAWELTTSQHQEFTLNITISEGATADIRIASGEKNPYLGWYSPAQGISLPSRVLRIHVDVPTRSVITTTVQPRGS